MAEQYKLPLIIALTGKAKSGKDTAVSGIIDALTSKYGCIKRSHRLAFADPIREIGNIFGFTNVDMTDQSRKETYVHPIWGVTPRKFMQLVGSEMFRNHLNADCWVHHMRLRITNIFELTAKDTGHEDEPFTFYPKSDEMYSFPPDIIFITDLRFPNEAKLIKDLGGIIIKVNRDGLDDGSWRNHESERYLNDIPADAVWNNNASSADEWKRLAGDAIKPLINKKNILV